MNKTTLKVQKRDKTGKHAKLLREDGLVPAVMYGHGIENVNLVVDLRDLNKVYAQSGESSIIQLDIDGGEKADVLIYDTQIDPLSDVFTHIDFFKVKMDEEIESEIPLIFVGEPPAVKELGGTLVKNIDHVTVKCLPGDLPSNIEVNTETLATFDDYVKVIDLKVSDKVKIMGEEGTIVASVSAPRSQEELESLDEKIDEDVTKVEATAEKKEDEAPAAEENNNK